MKTFIYFYFMKAGEAGIVREKGPCHAHYWHSLHLPGFVGGPFDDRSGGMIQFEAENIEEVKNLVTEDPFVIYDLVDRKWIKEWHHN